MSYSFNIKAQTKAAAKEAVADKFAEIVAQQPIHARDCSAVLANANAVIDLLAEDEAKDVSVTCNGYVSWSSGGSEDAKFNSASISCNAGHADRT